jgi:hypothetical protein
MPELAQTSRAPNLEDEKPRNDTSFIYQAISRFHRAASAESINRKAGLDDLRFKNGEQWPEDIRAKRNNEQRPCLTINKVKTFVHQITNEQRQNRPSINISPVGDRSDPETAKMLKGLIRQIERQSNADVAYDTGFDGAVSNGWGYWRILTEYEGEKTFDQVLRIGRIRNPFRVYLDPDHQEPDGSDAQWGFISDMMTRSEFKDLYPKAKIEPWQESATGDEVASLWSTETHVRIAEYFYYETKVRRLVALEGGHQGYYDELDPSVQARMKLNPSMVKKDREVQCKSVKWCKLTQHEKLEEVDWLGKWIPIIKVIGDEVDIEGRVSFAGVIRDSKDPQRMKNYWATAKTELVALAPKAPWIMEEGQVEGHEKAWREANNKSNPYLLYKGASVGGKPAPPPQRQQFAGPPAGVIQAEESAEQDMMATTGIRFDATKGERVSDESGRALQALKMVGEVGSYHYTDNLARSLKFTGRQLVDLIPKYYDTPRILTILREDNTQQQIKIDPQAPAAYSKAQGENGVQHIFNPKVGEYEVDINVGPSFATKRQEARESMIGFLKVLPNAAPLVGDLVAKNMDWPGAEQFAERLATMLPPQVLQSQVENLPPEAKAIVSSLQAELQKLQKENQTAVAMLGDKEADRQIQRDKIEKDFDAKMAKVFSDYEIKMGGMITDASAQFTSAIESMETSLKLHQQEMDHRQDSQQKDLDHRAELQKTQDKMHEAIIKALTAERVSEVDMGNGKKMRAVSRAAH